MEFFDATHTAVILRCEAAPAASLEGWQQTPALVPSFEARLRQGSSGHLRMTPGNKCYVSRASHRVPREVVAGALQRRQRGAEDALELLVELFRRPAIGAVDC